MYDFNDAAPQRGGLIPDGTFVKVVAHIRKGGIDGQVPDDAGLLLASKSSDAMMLDFEMTVLHGPHARSKLWAMMTVAGGKLDDHGHSKGWNITKSTLRAMLESSLGVDPKDESPEAKTKRSIQALSHFDEIQFVAKVGVEPGGDNPRGGTYPDKNVLRTVVTPDMPQWNPVMNGQDVAPAPSGSSGSSRPRASAPAPNEPSWKLAAAPAMSQGTIPLQPAAAATAAKPGPKWMQESAQ